MVLSFSNSLMVAAQFAWQQGKACVHTNQGTFRTLTLTEGANIINLPISHKLGTTTDGPRFLWQLPWVLSGTQRTCCSYSNHLTVFQGQPGILSNTPPHLATMGAALPMHSVCRIYLLKDPYLSQGISLLTARGCQYLISWKTLRTASGSCR